MRHPWVRGICSLALAVMTGQLAAEAQDRPTRRITVTVMRDEEPFAGIIMWMLDGGHHVRAEVFLDKVRWMHVELAGSITNKQANLADYFGRGGSYMIVMNEGINFALPGPNGVGNVGSFDGFVLCKERGDWGFPHANLMIADRRRSKQKKPGAAIPKGTKHKSTVPVQTP